MHYMDFIETAEKVDVSEQRASTRQWNYSFRQSSMPISEIMFQKRYRLSTASFKELVAELAPHMPKESRSDCLDLEMKILVALSFYATGSYQTPIGDNVLHPLSQASVSKCIKEVTLALNKPEVLNRHVAFPFRRSDREAIRTRFYKATKMFGALACIDGTHVALIKPKYHEERFINRKGYHSLNVLIMCDADLNILAVDSSYPGSTHDSKVWEGHFLKKYLERLHEEGEDIYILGDSGYPLRSTLMTPILNAEPGSPEALYTELHISARSAVERCIGVLKARFRCLLVDRKLHYTPETAARITNACCVLHNIAHAAGIDYERLTSDELRRERQLSERANWQRGTASSTTAANRAARVRQLRDGRERRNALVRLLWRQNNNT